MHEEYLKRIAEALERAYPNPPDSTFFTKADAFIWKPELKDFEIIKKISGVNLSMLRGMDEEKEIVLIFITMTILVRNMERIYYLGYWKSQIFNFKFI